LDTDLAVLAEAIGDGVVPGFVSCPFYAEEAGWYGVLVEEGPDMYGMNFGLPCGYYALSAR
jgi:hypothetical protein